MWIYKYLLKIKARKRVEHNASLSARKIDTKRRHTRRRSRTKSSPISKKVKEMGIETIVYV